MLHSDLNGQIHTKPFRPFRVQMMDGSTYDVRFREAFMLTPTALYVGLLPSTEGTTYERVVMLDLMSIIAFEHLPAAAAAKGNGQPSA